MRVRHEGISFNFCGKGEWYEMTTDEIERFENRHPEIDLEYEQDGIITRTKQSDMIDRVNAAIREDEASANAAGIEPFTAVLTDQEIALAHEDYRAPPTHITGPWWEYNGKKYRGKKALPPEARAMIEE